MTQTPSLASITSFESGSLFCVSFNLVSQPISAPRAWPGCPSHAALHSATVLSGMRRWTMLRGGIAEDMYRFSGSGLYFPRMLDLDRTRGRLPVMHGHAVLPFGMSQVWTERVGQRPGFRVAQPLGFRDLSVEVIGGLLHYFFDLLFGHLLEQLFDIDFLVRIGAHGLHPAVEAHLKLLGESSTYPRLNGARIGIRNGPPGRRDVFELSAHILCGDAFNASGDQRGTTKPEVAAHSLGEAESRLPVRRTAMLPPPSPSFSLRSTLERRSLVPSRSPVMPSTS